jgi:hypothetical protein
MRVRGEFKTPGGKLIAVEFDVVDNRLRGVVVTGDFFLYPEEAFSRLAGALEGDPADLDESDYAANVRSALGTEIALLGSSPEALAKAVRRALDTVDIIQRDDDR